MSGILENLNAVAGTVLAAVLNSFWMALAVVMSAWAALKFMAGVNAATRYAVWWAVLAVILILPGAPQRFAVWQAQPVPVAAAAPALDLVEESAVRTSPAAPTRPPLLPINLRSGPWLSWILALWGSVLAFHLVKIAWSYRYIRAIKSRSRRATRAQRLNFDEWLMVCRIRRPAQLLVSTEIASPMAVGFLRPAVILPETLLSEFTEPELDHVLLHELAHIARRDDWTNLMARLAAAALALHPVAAWVLRRIEREREIACDDWVVAMTGSARPYAASLARLFELCWGRRHEMLATGITGGASRLGERIEMLLHHGREFAPHASPARVAICAVVLLSLGMAGAQMPRWIAFAQEPVIPSSPALPATPPASPKPLVAQVSNLRGAGWKPAPLQPVVATVEPTPPQASAERKNSLLAALVAAGYGNLSVDEIIELKVNGVSGEFIDGINQSGWGKLTPKQLIDLRIQGVTPEYVKRMREAGIANVTLREVIDMRVNGVRPEYMQEIHALGFGPYSARQAIEFAMYGVRPDLFRALKENGFAHVDANEIIEARIHGLRAENLREAKTYGQSLTLKQIIRLKQAGVI